MDIALFFVFLDIVGMATVLGPALQDKALWDLDTYLGFLLLRVSWYGCCCFSSFFCLMHTMHKPTINLSSILITVRT